MLQSLLSDYPELARALSALEAFDHDALSERPVCVAALGLYNGGKSTLLNALTDQIEAEYFPTACVRETRTAKILHLPTHDVMDTPGIDAQDEDDAHTFASIVKADVLLMVHNLRLGELDAQALDYLAKIQKQSTEPLHERLLCVLTHAEGKRAEFTSLIEMINAQLHHISGKAAPIFLVSSTIYLQGRREGQQAFIQASGIPVLQSTLARRISELQQTLTTVRAKKRQTVVAQVYEHVIQAMQGETQQIHHLQRSLAEKLQRANENSAQLLRSLQGG